MTLRDRIDHVADYLFRVPRLSDTPAQSVAGAPAERALGISVLISALRCTVQYLILPVILPLIGLSSRLALPLAMLLDLLALLLLQRGLRYFWSIRHPQRFDLLPLAAAITLLIIGSLGYDIWRLLA